MYIKRTKPEDIVPNLRQIEILIGQGMTCLEAIKRLRFFKRTYHCRLTMCDGMGVNHLKKPKRLKLLLNSISIVFCFIAQSSQAIDLHGEMKPTSWM